MTHLKRSISSIVILIALLGGACGVPRADLEQALQAKQVEKEALTAQIHRLEDELKTVKRLLSEKKAEFEAIFNRYETLSRDYLRLKKEVEIPPSTL
jgi:chromosome segregation ATPase